MSIKGINIKYIINDLAKNTEVFDFLFGVSYDHAMSSVFKDVMRKFLQMTYFSGETSITYGDVNKITNALWFMLNGYEEWVLGDLAIIKLMES